MELTLGQLAHRFDLQLCGNPDLVIRGIGSLTLGESGELGFYGKKGNKKQIQSTKLSAVILTADCREQTPLPALITENPKLIFARITQLFAEPLKAKGIHPSAIIPESVQLGHNVSVGAHVVLGEGVVIGDGSHLKANVFIGNNVTIGQSCVVHPNVTCYDNISLGDRVILHSGVVIGADGFGYVQSDQGHEKLAQLAAVRIGDDVEIGANTTIDRGALEDTLIGKGTKIDNQVQIGHGVKVGERVIICGAGAVGGSTVLGDDVVLAGCNAVADNLQLGAGVVVTASSLVAKDLLSPGVYSSGFNAQPANQFRRIHALMKRLPELFSRVKSLEKEHV